MRMAASSISAWPLLRRTTVCSELAVGTDGHLDHRGARRASRAARRREVHRADPLDLAPPAVQVNGDVGLAGVRGDPELLLAPRRACAAGRRRRSGAMPRSGRFSSSSGSLDGWSAALAAAKYRILGAAAMRRDDLVVAEVACRPAAPPPPRRRGCPGGRPAISEELGMRARSRFRVLPEPDLAALRQIVRVADCSRRSAPGR